MKFHEIERISDASLAQLLRFDKQPGLVCAACGCVDFDPEATTDSPASVKADIVRRMPHKPGCPAAKFETDSAGGLDKQPSVSSCPAGGAACSPAATNGEDLKGERNERR